MKQFKIDAHSKKYKCAITLENVVNEINQEHYTRRVNSILNRFNKYFTDVKKVKHSQYFGGMLIDRFRDEITISGLPDKVETLLLNVIRTRYKAELLLLSYKKIK